MNKEAPDGLELSQGVTPLNLSTESGFYADWKQSYHVDTEQAILNPCPTDTIMASITRLISTLCAKFQLSHTIEFSAIDTLEQFVIKVIAGERGASVGENYLKQMPLYAVSVVNLVSKYFDAHIKLDWNGFQRMFAKYSPGVPWSSKRMMELEFEVMKKLNHKVSMRSLFIDKLDCTYSYRRFG